MKLAEPLFRSDFAYDAKSVAKHWKMPTETRELLAAIRTTLIAQNGWGSLSETEQAFEALSLQTGLKLGELAKPLRVALYGADVSPGVFEMILFLGRERTAERIKRAEAFLAGHPV